MSNFNIKELVDPQIYAKYKEEAWKLLDKRLIQTLDQIKERYHYTMIINDWSWNKSIDPFDQRGYRSPQSTTGKKDGAHYRGMAADIDFYDKGKLIPANTIRSLLYKDIKFFPFIRCFETGINWVHLDIMGQEDSPIKRGGVTSDKIMLVDAQNKWKIVERSKLV
jgi:hypothetical protein